MLYWECKRRLTELRSFRELVREYFENTRFDARGKRQAMPEIQTVRTRINRMIPEIVKSGYKVGYTFSLEYVHPGFGVQGRVNVMENIFNLDAQQIPVSKAFDSLDRVIGEYERLQARLRKQSWNPLYWLRLGFLGLLRLPFSILSAAGFNAKAFEQTVAGRIVKLVFSLVIFAAALLQLLSLLGLPTGWRDLVRVIHHR